MDKLRHVEKNGHLGELGCKIGTDIRPVYTSRMIGHEVKPKQKKPPIINQQRVVYHYNTNYVRYTCRHLCQRVEEHKGSFKPVIIFKSSMEQFQVTYPVI